MVKVRTLGAGTTTRVLPVFLLALYLVSAPTHPAGAQAIQPVTGFVSPYEIANIVRAAGFDPLAPPLREGRTYVLRATDFRGVLMRVVVDGHTGAIRAVNRIVAGPGSYGPVGMAPYAAPPHVAPPFYGPYLDGVAPREAGAPPSPPRPAAVRSAPHASSSALPLPRPRPAELASRRPLPKPDVKSSEAPMPPLPAAPLND